MMRHLLFRAPEFGERYFSLNTYVFAYLLVIMSFTHGFGAEAAFRAMSLLAKINPVLFAAAHYPPQQLIPD